MLRSSELHQHDHRIAVRGRDEQQLALGEELVDRPVQALLDVLDDRLLLFAHAVDEGLEAVDVDQHDELLGPRLEAEEGKTAGDLLFVEIAGDELVEEVPGKAFLGLGDGLLLDQLESRDGDHVMQDDAVVVGELAAVLDDGEKGADAVRGHHRIDLHGAAPAVGHLDREVLPRGALVGDLLPEVGDQLGGDAPPMGGLAEHDPVEVVEHRRTADQGGERRDDELQAFLFEDDLGELLVDRERALQKRVLFVDDLRGDGLGDGDERDVVGHLEQRKVVLSASATMAVGHGLEAEAHAEAEAREIGVDQALQHGELFGLAVDEREPRREQQLAALEPAGGVGHLGDVHPAHRVADRLLARAELEVETGDLEDVLNGDHVGVSTSRSVPSPYMVSRYSTFCPTARRV